MVHFNVAKMNGDRINEVSQVSIILETLPKSFLHFISNAVLNRVDYTLTTLLHELQTFQSLLKGKKKVCEANVVSSSKNFLKGSTSRTKFAPSSFDTKKWKKKKGSKGKGKLSTNPQPATPRGRQPAPVENGKCFHYNQDGHWKRNCSHWLKEKKKAKANQGD
ncbi:uncharacterized protein LOC120067099 [Benincasa hispida]|uniref:uncharacterized protein LOC120067099 n=1 Tax=Benincasa hispida TaxID=102211 RepID=UPI001901DC53|nr:uncharacterized protein LOC120067099 [Benincasa hispida]